MHVKRILLNYDLTDTAIYISTNILTLSYKHHKQNKIRLQ